MTRKNAIKLWSKHNLPSDLWPEILYRLPVRSLLRFRCVSKSWRSLIDDPEFCHLHLNTFQNNTLESQLLVNQYGANKHWCVIRCSKTFKDNMKLHTLNASNGCTKTLPIQSDYWSVICSLDRLVLLTYSESTGSHSKDELILWNPSIRRARTLYVSFDNSEEFVDLGFGFNPLIKDYKHVRFVTRGENNLHSVEVYTVGVGSWRKIQLQIVGGWRWTFRYNYSWKSVCCQGILYFTPRTIISDVQELVSFDLSTEVFASTRLPEPTDDGGFISHKALALVDGGCSLGWVTVSQTKGSIWVLESCGAANGAMHWTNRYTFSAKILSEWSLRNFLYVKKNGEMLLQWHKQVTSYDLETHEEKTLIMNGRGLRMSMVCGYKESLLLLHG